MVEGMLGEHYERPLTKMRSYLDGMDAAPYMAEAPTSQPQRVLAALGPKMLGLAAERAAGAHPYFVPVEYTARRRHRGVGRPRRRDRSRACPPRRGRRPRVPP